MGEYVTEVVNSREELEKFVQEGQTLNVMYNPGFKIQELRVLYPEEDFHNNWKQKRKDMMNTAYGPFIISMLICFLLTYVEVS